MKPKRRSPRSRKTSFLRLAMLWQVIIPIVLAVLCVALGTVGFHEYYRQKTSTPSAKPGGALTTSYWEAFLSAAGLPLLETTSLPAPGEKVPLALNIARTLGLMIPPYAFFVILFIASRKPFKQFLVWSWSLNSSKRYAVIGGLGWRGSELVEDLRARNFRVVVIEKDRDNPFVASLEGGGVVVFNGDATAIDLLRKARVRFAEMMFVTTNSDEVNWRIVKQIAEVKPAGHRTVRCYVHAQGHRMRELLEATTRGSGIRVQCFNMFETIARRLLARCPVCRFGNVSPGARVRILIMGYTPIAKAILLQLLRIGHYLKDQQRSITVITKDAAQSRADFLREYPSLAPKAFAADPEARRLCDEVFPRLDFLELPLSDTELLDDDFVLFKDMTEGSLTSLFVCLDDGMTSAAYVINLKDKLESERRQRKCECQVCYYFNYPEDEVGEPVRQTTQGANGLAIVAFGNFLEECTVAAIEGRDLDIVAKEIAAHYTRKYADDATKKELEAMSEEERQLHFDTEWDQSPEWGRESNRQAADHIRIKCLCIGAKPVIGQDGEVGFDAEEVANHLKDEKNVRFLVEMEHRRWCAEKLLAGWRPLPSSELNRERWNQGTKLFQSQKLHIDLTRFEQLPPKEQSKDFSQILGIPQFLRNAEARRQRQLAR